MKLATALATVLMTVSSTSAFHTPIHPRITSIHPRSKYPISTITDIRTSTTTPTTTALEAIPAAAALSSIAAPIGSISVLAFVILIHEAGHFLAARSFDIKVKEFSVGVGPKITGFTRHPDGRISMGKNAEEGEGNTKVNDEDGDDDEGIEFNLRAIPLGGYVRFPENYNATLEYQMEVEADSKRREIQSIMNKNREENGTDGLLATIGARWNKKQLEAERIAALESMAIKLDDGNAKMIMGMGNEANNGPWWKNMFNFGASKEPEREPRSITIEKDGTVTIPPIEYYQDPDLLQNRPWTQRAVVLVGGVVFNILLAFTLYFGELTVGGGLNRPNFDQGVVVNTVPRANSASVGLLDRGDVILSFNGQPISSAKPTMYSSQEAISSFISDIRATTNGDVLHLSVQKANTNTITEMDITPIPLNDNDATSPLSIGIMIAPNYTGNKIVKASNPTDAAVIAATEVSELTYQTARTILGYIGGLLQGGKAPAGQSLSGPIGVIKTGSDVVASNDVAAVIGFASAISINLAVVNSLPLPALDGGQLVFVAAEAITGRKVDQRKQEAITSAALLFLLIVSFSTAVGDVTSFAK